MGFFDRWNTRSLNAVALGAVIAFSSTPAQAADFVFADYENVFTTTSTYDVVAGALYHQPADDDDIFGSTISGGLSIPYGTSSLVDRPIFFGDQPTDTPSATTLYGLTTLSYETSVYDGADPTQLHFVVAVADDYANTIIGKSFQDAFAGFSSFDYPDPLDEQNFISELLYISGLDQQYGLPVSEYGGPQTNLLFNFGLYLRNQGGSLTSGDYQLVAFSTGTSIGSGTVTQNIVTSPVPEPATWGMMILGFGVTGGVLRRSRRQAHAALA